MENKPVTAKTIYCTRCRQLQMHLVSGFKLYQCIKCGKQVRDEGGAKPQVLKLK